MRCAAAFALAGLALSACAPAHPAVFPAAPPSLALAAEFIIPPGTSFTRLRDLRFGGLSGVVSIEGGHLLAVSDDRENSRVIQLRVEHDASSMRLVPVGIVVLERATGAPAKLDPEAIALTPDGNMLISSEGVLEEEPRVPPAIVEYTRAGRFVRQLPVPGRFVPNAQGPLTTGVRLNAGFESLTVTPDGERLFTANELPLVQDDDEDTMADPRPVRIVEYTRAGGSYAPTREFVYEIASFGAVPFAPGFIINGVVELLALSGTELLVLERGFVQSALDQNQSLNRIRIFRASLEGSTDVSGVESLRGRTYTPVRKTLIADLNALEGLSPSLRNLENFEAFAWADDGGGSRSLLVVSDDNFSTRQVTAFLLLRAISSEGLRPFGLPHTLSRAPLRRRAPFAWLTR